MTRSVHFSNGKQDGCKTRSVHIGGYLAVSLQEFQAMPVERQCQRCLNGKVFKLWTRAVKAA